MRAERPLLGVALIGLLLLTAGCGREHREPIVDTFPYFSHPGIEQVRRIVILPAFRADGVGTSAKAVDQALASAWRELGKFEIVIGTMDDRERLLPDDALRRGVIPSSALRTIRTDFSTDAVLLTRIEHLNSYDPVAIGLHCALVDCGDGSVLWTAGGHFDGQRSDVQDDVQSWYRATIGDGNENIAGWRTTLLSPRLFARYVCDRLATTSAGKPPEPDSGITTIFR